MATIQELLETYIAALRTGADDASSSAWRSEYMQRLAVAGEMRTALEQGDTSELSSLLNAEQRILGWTRLGGPSGATVTSAFQSLRAEELKQRLDGKPDAW
jgi:hypothetical protein